MHYLPLFSPSLPSCVFSLLLGKCFSLWWVMDKRLAKLHVAASNKSIINRLHACSRPFVPKYSLISWSTLLPWGCCCWMGRRFMWSFNNKISLHVYNLPSTKLIQWIICAVLLMVAAHREKSGETFRFPSGWLGTLWQRAGFFFLHLNIF